MNEWNTTKTLNCGDIRICINCGKRFDEEESLHMFFCSDRCKGIFELKTWRETNVLRIEEMQKQMNEGKE